MEIPLSTSIPIARASTIPQIIAFPTSLAALKSPVRWNATCWVADRRLDDFEAYWIGRKTCPDQSRLPHIEWLNFASDVTSQVSMHIVFPSMRTSFRSTPELMEKWTDQIVLPAFQKFGVSAGILSTSWNVIRLTAEAERVETLNVNAPDTALREVLGRRDGLSPEDLDRIWRKIKETADSNAFWGFRDLSLVAVYHHIGNQGEQSLENSWNAACEAWDAALDMRFIPQESVRAQAAVTFGPNIGSPLPFVYFPTGASEFQTLPQETSRKRRNDDTIESPKRLRFEDGNRQIWPLARSHTLSTMQNSDSMRNNRSENMERSKFFEAEDFNMDLTMAD